MSTELAGIDWIDHGWRLTLAFTAALLLVAVLRKGCRRLFGAERAFQLWVLPPLALLASQLPHADMASATALLPVVYAITAAPTALSPHDIGPAAIDWRAAIAMLWLAGIAARLLTAAVAQSRNRAIAFDYAARRGSTVWRCAGRYGVPIARTSARRWLAPSAAGSCYRPISKAVTRGPSRR
jgi:hypothetical protein